jgi:hypothetical protein
MKVVIHSPSLPLLVLGILLDLPISKAKQRSASDFGFGTRDPVGAQPSRTPLHAAPADAASYPEALMGNPIVERIAHFFAPSR